MLGAISAAYNLQFNGIVLQAVLATLAVFATMLFLYATRLVKVTDRFRRITLFAMVGIMVHVPGVVRGVEAITGNVAVHRPADAAGHRPLGGHRDRRLDEPDAQLRLHRAGRRRRRPAYMEWYGAFGLMIALVWLYLEILRLLALLNRR